MQQRCSNITKIFHILLRVNCFRFDFDQLAEIHAEYNDRRCDRRCRIIFCGISLFTT